MAKKKKGKARNDARGYGQPAPAPLLLAPSPEPPPCHDVAQQQGNAPPSSSSNDDDDDDLSRAPQKSQQEEEEEELGDDDVDLSMAAANHQEQPQISASNSNSNSMKMVKIRKVPSKLLVVTPPVLSSSSSSLTTSASSTSMIMTADLQDRLEALLQDLQQHHHHPVAMPLNKNTTTTSSLTSKTDVLPKPLDSFRLEKRLAGVYDHLDHYGFKMIYIEKVVAALGQDITVPRALDWLCLHLPTIELPPLFTEVRVRDESSLLQQQQQQNSNSTTIIIGPQVWIAPAILTVPTESVTLDDAENIPETTVTADHAERNQGTGDSADDVVDMEDDDDDEEENVMYHQAAAVDKERLLQMYQYEEEEEEEETDLNEVNGQHDDTTRHHTAAACNDDLHHHHHHRQVNKEESVQQQQHELPQLLLLPEEKEEERLLATAQKELDLARADVQDEAANYMRSKYEIKQLQKRVQQLQKIVSGLQRKKTTSQARAAAAIIAATNDEIKEKQQLETIQQKDDNDNDGDDSNSSDDDDDDDDDDDGLFGMFDMDETATAHIANGDKQKIQSEPHQDPSCATVDGNSDDSNIIINADVVPEDAIPKSWTGKTPKEVLEDWCRKQKLPRPTFTKLPQNGCLVRVKMNNNSNSSGNDDIVQIQQIGPLYSFIDAQHYTSSKLLYQINSHLPLYRLFPPAYRELWKSWTLQVQTEKEQATMVEDQARRAILDHLLQLIPSTTTKSPSSSSIQKNAAEPQSSHTKHDGDNDNNKGGDGDINKDNDGLDEYVTENWEDQGDKVESNKKPKSSRINSSGSGSGNNNKKNTKLEEGFHRLKQTFRDRQATPKYQNMYKQRCTLPIYAYRDEILDSVTQNPVTVLCAETGAGKTTQCPQFLLEHALQGGGGGANNDSAANTCILVSQPRRIAATSVAERVAEEMCERSVGNLVGYQIRLEAKRTTQTRLLFCTTGVVLRRLIDDPCLSGVSHVVVDEVHERQWQIDVLLVSLRRLIDGPRPDLKVLLMSATLDTSLFCTFFNGAPVLNIPGRTFPVASYYLEDLMEATNFVIEGGSQFARRDYQKETTRMWVTQRGGEKRQETVMTEVELDKVSDDYIGYSMSTRRSMDRVDETKINYDLIEDVLMKLLVDKVPSDILVPPAGAQLQSGAVLIFLPGIGEIRTLSERLQSNQILGDSKRFEVIPMHSALSASDQRKAFIVPRKVEWAIIVSTNIAETSVTIPDAVCVIDSGRVREVRHDKRTLTRKLVTDWCSRASTKQRGGRAGRVQPGICLKLFSSQTERSMNAATAPEIKRLPLEEVCLTILAGGFARNCIEFLGQTPQPPGDDAVRLALSVLAEIGAVAFGPDSSELLTPLGRHLAKLPVDCRLGKMLIFGVILQCIDPIATIVAGLSASQSLFVTSLKDGQVAKARKAAFTYPDSDFLTIANVYESYLAADKIGKGRQFCRENYLSLSALREIKDGRRHYLELLRGIGFSIKLGPTAACMSSGHRKDEGVIHAVICAGLYPNVARIDRTPRGDSVWHKKERLYIHSSSVNVKLPRYLQSPWLAFHEKFGTTSRVSMSTCCFVHPFALLLFGGALEVHHAERRVLVDDWIELALAAKTGVIFAELRQHIDAILETAVHSADGSFIDQQDVCRIVQDIVGLLS